MKQLNNIIFVFILSLISAQAMAQEEKTRKWDISITLGQAAPIGSYSKVAPEETLNTEYPGLHFYKEGNGAAKTGGFRSLEVSYLLNKHWVASIIANRSRNSVNTGPVKDYINSVLDQDFYAITHNDYVVNSVAIGMGYQFQVKKLEFRIIPILGDASISSPEYGFITKKEYYKGQYYFDVPIKQNAILLGFNSSINYELGSMFYIGLKTGYHSANFNYAVRKFAPGIKALLYNDVINYRLVETGIVLGIKL
ncbi:MAG: hypothetical protein C0397_15225 [Odoribacter sp.]|nr:hypothetical protein [Odoribacter sp.]